MTLTEQLDALEVLAKKATPGPWTYDVRAVCLSLKDDAGIIWSLWDKDSGPAPRDGSYIAAVNPTAILSLIAAVRDALQAAEARALPAGCVAVCDLCHLIITDGVPRCPTEIVCPNRSAQGASHE